MTDQKPQTTEVLQKKPQKFNTDLDHLYNPQSAGETTRIITELGFGPVAKRFVDHQIEPRFLKCGLIKHCNLDKILYDYPEGIKLQFMSRLDTWRKVKENQKMCLKVLGADGRPLLFKVDKHTPLNKLMSLYCEKYELSMDFVKFLFKGQPINGNDTPGSLRMKDGDTIELCFLKIKNYI